MPCIEDAIYERNRTSGPIDTFTTSRGTHVEFFEDSEFGFVCIMDGKIQSATADEASVTARHHSVFLLSVVVKAVWQEKYCGFPIYLK